MLADCTDLIQRCADATARQLVWKDKGSQGSVWLAAESARGASISKRQTELKNQTESADHAGGAMRAIGLATKWIQQSRYTSFAAPRPHYAIFISYYRLEAGTTARWLQLAISHRLKRPVFLDATDADNIDSIISEGLLASDAVLLLLTKNVFTRPFVLLEVPCLPLPARSSGDPTHD